MHFQAVAAVVAKRRDKSQPATAICSVCGYTVKGPNPVVTCPVCKAAADKFQIISKEAVEAIATQEGGVEAEEAMPGVPVKWSAEARDALREVTVAYLRRGAAAKGVTAIDLAVCEEGIGHARETMNEVIAGYVSNKKPR